MLFYVLTILIVLMFISTIILIIRLRNLKRRAGSAANSLYDTILQDYEFIKNSIGMAEGFREKIEEYRDSAGSAREDVNDMLEKELDENPGLFGAWAVFEPDKFDGSDAEFAGSAHYDDTGRFNYLFLSSR